METSRLSKKTIEKNRRERFNRAIDKQREICLAWDPHFAQTSRLEKNDILEQMAELCRQRQQADARLCAAIQRFDPSFNSASPEEVTTKVIEFINKVMDEGEEASKTSNTSSPLISDSPSTSSTVPTSATISPTPPTSNNASSSSDISAAPSVSNDDTYSDPEPTPPRAAKRKVDDSAETGNNAKRPAPGNFADITNFYYYAIMNPYLCNNYVFLR